MKISLQLMGALFWVSQLAMGAEVKVRSGGQLVPNQKQTYYLETIQNTEIIYKNALVGPGAEVSIEIGEVVSRIEGEDDLTRDDWYDPKVIPMKQSINSEWAVTLPTSRFGLGAQKKTHGLSFHFLVKYPGQPATIDSCDQEGGHVFRVWFQKPSSLNWAKMPPEPIKMEAMAADCSWQ